MYNNNKPSYFEVIRLGRKHFVGIRSHTKSSTNDFIRAATIVGPATEIPTKMFSAKLFCGRWIPQNVFDENFVCAYKSATTKCLQTHHFQRLGANTMFSTTLFCGTWRSLTSQKVLFEVNVSWGYRSTTATILFCKFI